jgi:3-hydroxyisobutyrate dehydrogenase-like beta-hydroxyacid dehydrogenase
VDTEKNDVQISFIGLGPMGRALARRLLEAGRKITVANRSPEKADPFERLGASVSYVSPMNRRAAEYCCSTNCLRKNLPVKPSWC